MSDLGSQIESDLQAIEADMGSQTIIYKTETYVCTPATGRETLILDVGGFERQADLVITIRMSLFTDAVYPASQEKITYNSKSYRIADVKEDATHTFMKLICVSATRGS